MNSEGQYDIKRIQALTDATFAVAMTILILEIKIPRGLSEVELEKFLSENVISELFIYFIGFMTLGTFWISSHFHHNLIAKTDRISSWLNISFLMLICIIPLSSGFLKNYRYEKLSIIFFCINLITASALNFLMLWYAWKKKFIKPDYTKSHIKKIKQRILIPICCYLAIIIISFFSTNIVIFLFLIPTATLLLPEKRAKS